MALFTITYPTYLDWRGWILSFALVLPSAPTKLGRIHTPPHGQKTPDHTFQTLGHKSVCLHFYLNPHLAKNEWLIDSPFPPSEIQFMNSVTT